MRKNLLCLAMAALLLPAVVSAQKSKSKKSNKKAHKENVIIATSNDGEEIEFTILDDSPQKLNKLYLGLDYAECEIGYPTTFQIKAALNAKYLIDNKFLLQAKVAYSYLDVIKFARTDEVKAQQANLKMPTFLSTDVGGTYLFSSNYKVTDTRIVLSERRSGNTRYSTVLKLPARRMLSFGARMGYYYQQYSVDWEMAKEGDFLVDETALHAVYMHNIYAGFCIFNSRNIIIESDQFGKSQRSGFTQIYTDVLFSPSIRGSFYSSKGVDPFKDEPFIPLDDEIKGYKKSYVGGRIGVEKIIYHGKFLTKLGIETGVRPGYANLVNFYLGFGMGLGFTQ